MRIKPPASVRPTTVTELIMHPEEHLPPGMAKLYRDAVEGMSDNLSRPYVLEMMHCTRNDHEGCPSVRQPTSDMDPRPTVCLCCAHGHYREETKTRITEWRITRNWLRAGEPCRVKDRGMCIFRALLTNGDEQVEVLCKGKVHKVSPGDVTRVVNSEANRIKAKTRGR